MRAVGMTGASAAAEWGGVDAAEHLRRVESRLRAVAAVPDDRLAELALHLIDAGGKRLRPRLVLAAAIASRGHSSVDGHVIAAAVAVELLHLASLYHDDVLDAAPLRRGRPSVNAVWGDHAAVLGGDILLAHAYTVAAELRPAELLRICDTLTQLCAGQIAESDAQFNRARGVDEYEQAIRGKTAALLTTSCWLGASTAGAPAHLRDLLAEYGTQLGIAFQVIDDVLDLHGDGGRLGKLAGSDLREGVFTLPVLLARRADPDLDALLVEGIDEAGIAEVCSRVRAVGADIRALAFALDRLHVALSLVERGPFAPDGERLLTAMAASVLEPLDRVPLASGVGRDGVDGPNAAVAAR